MANWSELHVDILTSIIVRLRNISDYIRISGVCSLWRSIAKENHIHFIRRVQPGLMIPGPSPGSITLLPFPEKYVVPGRKLPSFCVPHDHRCIGSHEGWFTLLEEEGTNIYLLNPFARRRRNLPSLSILRTGYPHKCSVDRAIMSSSPSEPNCVILIFYGESGLSYCRLGDESWTDVDRGGYDDHRGTCGFTDALFCGGSFYLVDDHGTIFKLDVGEDDSSGYLERTQVQPTREATYKQKWYLVDIGGDLYRVLRKRYAGEGLYFDINDNDDDEEEEAYDDEKSCGMLISTRGFRIWKLDCRKKKKKKWITVSDLGAFALFLGCNNSICLSEIDTFGVRGNRIYFTDDRIDRPFCVICRGFDMGVYSLEDKSFEPLYSAQISQWMKVPPAIWITPLPW